MEIDYLSFVGYPGEPEAVEPSGKVAAVWAEIKKGIELDERNPSYRSMVI